MAFPPFIFLHWLSSSLLGWRYQKVFAQCCVLHSMQHSAVRHLLVLLRLRLLIVIDPKYLIVVILRRQLDFSMCPSLHYGHDKSR